MSCGVQTARSARVILSDTSLTATDPIGCAVVNWMVALVNKGGRA